MPQIVFQTLIDNATPLPPAGRVQSRVVDVNGARTVSLMFGIPSNDAEVHWSVHFGPTTNNGYGRTSHGTFESNNTIGIAVPVFGPGLMLVVENRGRRDQNVDGKLYFIRELP